jgi:hypothetical protein
VQEPAVWLARESVESGEGTMAEEAFFLFWGYPPRGREDKALQVFMDWQKYGAELKQQGKIADFSVYGMRTGNLTARLGVSIVKGTRQQLDALQQEAEWIRRISQAVLIVDNLDIVRGESGETLMKNIELGVSARKELGF